MWRSARYVCFGSGGNHGIAYDGMIRAIQHTARPNAYSAWFDELRGVAGTSAGSIYAIAFVLGVTGSTLESIFETFDEDWTSLISLNNVNTFNTKFGISKMTKLEELIEQILIEGGLSPHATMGNLKRYVRRDVVFVVTNVCKNSMELIRSETHANVRVVDAICASSAIPFVFEPIRINGDYMIDGGIVARIPDCFDPAETLYLGVTSLNRVSDIVSYISSCCACITHSNSRHIETSAKVEVAFEGNMFPFSSERIVDLVRAGFVCMLDHIYDKKMSDAIQRSCRAYIWLVCNPITTAVVEEPPPEFVSSPHEES